MSGRGLVSRLLWGICVVFALAGSVDAAAPLTDEQMQYMVPGVKYRMQVSPPNKPSIQTTPAEEALLKEKRGIYGGKGDKKHLGGFTDSDLMGISENVFNYMVGGLAVKSLVDVGCGKGVSTKNFLSKRVKVLCVEGSHDAVSQSLLPASDVVEHDFSLGPWWPKDTYDAVWSVEFLEHVGRQYMDNYLPVFHKSALLFVTSSGFGGWHHVEVHARWWWKSRLAAAGFVYSRDLSMQVREYAIAGKNASLPQWYSQHIQHSMMVFINPAVANLPKHKHLFGGHGCHRGGVDNNNGGEACRKLDKLPQEYEALLDCEVKTGVWNCQENPRAIPLV
ncbi:hypothetical protein B484DRAFT_442454 [Ochromonadaceae sp. CCMP2298]|nr:hypothetical protein B484DRAFT_442454 [Ochromonadaceae sp. CCMP2298]